MLFVAPTLTQVLRLTPTFELRERFERRVNSDFNDRSDNDKVDYYTRYRVGLKVEINSKWNAEVQYQYSHDLIQTRERNYSEDASDASLAYLETRQNGWTVTLGRQRISVGNNRLIAPLEWSFLSRSYDGVRARNKTYDLWVARVGLGPSEPDNLILAGATYKIPNLGETSVISKHDKVAGRVLDIVTLDQIVTKKLGSWTLDTEGALQNGHVSGKKQEAWALHGRISRTINPKLTAYVEGNSASGGSTSDVNRTFDNLYPANHPYYGLMDLQGWRNMNEVALGTDLVARKDVLVRLGWHRFWLRDPSDSWYAGSSGSVNHWSGGNFRDPTGKSGRDVGSELDFDATWQVTKNSSIQAGIGLFNPGRFVQKIRGSGDQEQWGFVQFQYKF